MAIPRSFVLAVAAGCGLTVAARGADDVPPAPGHGPVPAVVEHFAKNGIRLRQSDDNWREWAVVEPKGDGYAVVVALRSFRLGTSEKEMWSALAPISLAHLLNAPARVAMSYPFLRATEEGKRPPKLDQVPVVGKLKALFEEYRPPEPKRDSVYVNLPDAVRKVYEETFPGYRCTRLVRRGTGDAAVYRATVFDPASGGAAVESVGGESVATPILYHLELNAAARVLEETLRPVDVEWLPPAVSVAFRKWNPKEVRGRENYWRTEVPRGKDRVYRVQLILSAVKSYSASFKEDGTVVAADPAVVP